MRQRDQRIRMGEQDWKPRGTDFDCDLSDISDKADEENGLSCWCDWYSSIGKNRGCQGSSCPFSCYPDVDDGADNRSYVGPEADFYYAAKETRDQRKTETVQERLKHHPPVYRELKNAARIDAARDKLRQQQAIRQHVPIKLDGKIFHLYSGSHFAHFGHTYVDDQPRTVAFAMDNDELRAYVTLYAVSDPRDEKEAIQASRPFRPPAYASSKPFNVSSVRGYRFSFTFLSDTCLQLSVSREMVFSKPLMLSQAPRTAPGIFRFTGICHHHGRKGDLSSRISGDRLMMPASGDEVMTLSAAGEAMPLREKVRHWQLEMKDVDQEAVPPANFEGADVMNEGATPPMVMPPMKEEAMEGSDEAGPRVSHEVASRKEDEIMPVVKQEPIPLTATPAVKLEPMPLAAIPAPMKEEQDSADSCAVRNATERQEATKQEQEMKRLRKQRQKRQRWRKKQRERIKEQKKRQAVQLEQEGKMQESGRFEREEKARREEEEKVRTNRGGSPSPESDERARSTNKELRELLAQAEQVIEMQRMNLQRVEEQMRMIQQTADRLARENAMLRGEKGEIPRSSKQEDE